MKSVFFIYDKPLKDVLVNVRYTGFEVNMLYPIEKAI